jgi:hypothetical protein
MDTAPAPRSDDRRATGADLFEDIRMRRSLIGTLAGLAIAACAPPPPVQTVVAPEEDLGTFHTFQVVEMPAEYLGGMLPGATSPTWVNRSTSRALAEDITADIERRGYAAADANEAPDVIVEYSTAVREPLDPTDWEYDYSWRPDDWRGWGPGPNDATPAEYAQGAVVIDVLDGHTRHLLWRGHAPAQSTDDERTYRRRMGQTVEAIIDQLPERTLASR